MIMKKEIFEISSFLPLLSASDLARLISKDQQDAYTQLPLSIIYAVTLFYNEVS